MASVLWGPGVCAAAHTSQATPCPSPPPLRLSLPTTPQRVQRATASPRPKISLKRFNSRTGYDAPSLTRPQLRGFLAHHARRRARMTLLSARGAGPRRDAFGLVSRCKRRTSADGPLCRSVGGNLGRSSRRAHIAGVSECIPGLWKHRHWVLNLGEFWGVVGGHSGREVASAASGEGQVELSEAQLLSVGSSGSSSVGNAGLETCIGQEGSNVGEGHETVATTEEKLSQPTSIEDLRVSLDEVAVAATTAAETATDKLVESVRESKACGAEDCGTASSTQAEAGNPDVGLEDAASWRQVAMAADAGAALAMIADRAGVMGGVVGNAECSSLILEALAQGNGDLAFSILNAMRNSSLAQRRIDRQESGASREGWRWPQPNVNTYATLVRGLAASLRVSDAIETVGDVRRRGVPAGDEVPFGKVVSCPTCKTALAVVQPQQGVQVAPCASCRYQFELMSGTVVTCESESISMNISAFERGLRVLKLLQRPVPAAVHSLVVCAPDGLARTHRCATESADIPAQTGERVTVISAGPANAGRGIGPFKISARTPGWRPSEPMAITNHVTGRVSPLLRPPPKSRSGAAFDTSFVIPAALLLASSDAATALIDPSLPRAIAIGAAAAVALGGATNTFVLPRLNQLPQRTVDAMALRQQLLAQHESLQARLQFLTQAAADDVRMLARMCQLQNKMEAVGEPAYSARIERVRKAREGLDERLEARLELIDSYAKIASMIEIEVEMDVDVLAAEGAGAAAISEQIERLMEVEDLQKAWRLQAEANEEVERLLRSAPLESS